MTQIDHRLVTLLAVVGLCSLACGSRSDDRSGSAESKELVVFAAASLTDAFTEMAGEFEKVHPGVDVKFNFAGSQSLRTQIEQGAAPDVFASANHKHMDALDTSDHVVAPKMFAKNEMVIAVPAGNPAGIESLADLPRAERLVLAGPNVPAGAYAETVLANANATLGQSFGQRVMARVVSREMHVRQTLQKVVLGEADAAIVYATDAAAVAGKVEAVSIPVELNVTAPYPVAQVSGAPNPELAGEFVQFILSNPGQLLLEKYGFRAVTPPLAGVP